MSEPIFANEQDARHDIVRVGRSLFERAYVHSTAGNISVRLSDGFLITPTDACLGFLHEDRLARLDITGHQTSGDRASKTLALHRSIYDAEPSARCVIHSHSTHLVALTLSGIWRSDDILPPITPYYAMKVGHVPMIPYHVPGDAQIAALIAQSIVAAKARDKPIRAVMIERLGPNVWHQSLTQAMALLEELEETARLWLLTERKAQALSEAQLDALRQRFDAPW
jgi:3-dehydro-4-phosphotetronate decarboxylase